jgi:hypothetical protein
MANDIIDINVYETVETVAITVNPNLTTVNINQVTGGGGGGSTNLSTTQTASNFTINSDTGDDALVPLGNGTLAGATLNDYTTAEKNKLAAITGTNTGDQNLQSVTTLGATTTNPIFVNGGGSTNPVTGQTASGKAIVGIADTGTGVEGSSNTGIGVFGYSETGVAGEFNTDSATANIANFKNGGDVLASINYAGELTAQKLIKQGGTSSEILAADGSIITAGTNITITGGQISSVGGSGGGGSSVNYYLNGGTSQGTFGGTTYYEFSKTAVIGTGADFNRNTNGYIASFITDVADPSLLLIPAGNWNLEFFFSSSSAGGSPSFYAELYKYDGTTFTLIASGSAAPEGITNGTAIDAYFTALAVPETVLTVNDRLAIRVYVNASSKTITLHTQNGHLCEVITTFTAGLTALNGLQAQVQNFATGTTGTDFAINSSGSTHTFNLPSASATVRGVVTTTTQTFAGDKTFTGTIGASNLSGTNTGDETITTIKTKLGITTLSGSNTGDQDLSGYALLASPTFTGTPSLPTGTTGTTQTPLNNSTRLATTAYVEAACAVVAGASGVQVSSQDTFGTNKIATVTAAQYSAFVTAGTVSATTLYFITA